MWARLVQIALRTRTASFSVRLPMRRSFRNETMDRRYPAEEKLEIRSKEGHFILSIDLWNFDRKNRDALLVYLPSRYVRPMEKMTPENREKNLRNIGNVAGVLPPYLWNVPVPIVRINYRYHGVGSFEGLRDILGSTAQDVRTAITAIQKKFCNEKTKVIVYGRYLGAPLALSLALENSSPDTAGRVAAVAVDEGIFDWTALITRFKINNHSSLCDIEHIPSQNLYIGQYLRTRALLLAQFSKPLQCWDPYASPALYFWSAPIDIPDKFPVDEPQRKRYTIQDFEPISESPHRHVRFPPEGSAFEIPRVLISYNSGGIIQEQSVEMAKLLRNSIISDSGALDPWHEAEQRVQLVAWHNERDKKKITQFKQKRDKEIVKWLLKVLE